MSPLGLIRDLALLLGVALGVALIATFFETSYITAPPAPPTQGATTTLGAAPPPREDSGTTTPARTLEAPPSPLLPRDTPPALPPQQKSEVAAPKPVPPSPKVEDLNITLTDAIGAIQTLAEGHASGQSVNERVRAALVNVLCTSNGGTESITGSGVIIDPRGVVITNAHVAQFFLLKDYPTPNAVTCVIRTGSPAYPSYTAELLYLPPSWISDNAHKIRDEVPTGTGERDYALLRITGGVSAAIVLPQRFPFLLVGRFDPRMGEEVLQAGYAAGFLGGINILTDLYAASAWTKVRDVYTFNANTIDLIALGGSVVAQGGSSGGPVTNRDGVLIGVIVTSAGSGDTESRNLSALTTSYILRDFEAGRGKSLESILSTDTLAEEVAIFNQVYFPTLSAALKAAIER